MASSIIGGLGQLPNDIHRAEYEREQERQERFKEQIEAARLRIEQGQRQPKLSGSPVTWVDPVTKEQHSSYFSLDEKGQLVRRDLPGAVAPKAGAGHSVEDAQAAAAQMLGIKDYTGPDSVPPEQQNAFRMLTERVMKVTPIGAISKNIVQDPASKTGYSAQYSDSITQQPMFKVPNVAPPPGELSRTPTLNAEMAKTIAGYIARNKDPYWRGSYSEADRTAIEKAAADQGLKLPVRPAPASATGTPLSSTDYAAASWALNTQKLPWAQVTKGWKPEQISGFENWLKANGLPIPPDAISGKSGSGAARAAELDATLSVMQRSLFGDPNDKSDAGLGLVDTIGVLDNPKSRIKLQIAWSLVRSSGTPSLWARMTPEIINQMLASKAVSALTPDEYLYFIKLTNSATDIFGLREITGRMRPSIPLLESYVRELPDPFTTPDSKSGDLKLGTLNRDIKAAIEALKAGQPMPNPSMIPKGPVTEAPSEAPTSPQVPTGVKPLPD